MLRLKRTHTCGELGKDDIGNSVKIAGWVDKWRDHGGLVFIDLRDRYGRTQVVFDPKRGQQLHDDGRRLRSEFVIAVQGTVAARPEDMINPKIATGAIEVEVEQLEVLNKSETLPFDVSGTDLPNEDTRLKYRYLDLRREEMQRALALRHQLNRTIRNYLDRQGFLEVETPILAKSTPEGARDYLVPSRVQAGSFYALPQSPQIFKQLLMVASCDKYYQIARCFRDEDLRANRQPEFTQLDLEMSFVDRDDVMSVIDGLCAEILRETKDRELPLPLPRMNYDEAMAKYGSDSPDLRFGMELVDVTDIAAEVDFQVFRSQAESGGQVRGFCAKGAAAKYSRKALDELTAFVGDYGAKGLAWFRVEEAGLWSPTSKRFSEAHLKAIQERLEAEQGDLVLFVADKQSTCNAALGALRVRLGRELELYDPGQLHCSWVVDFPLLEQDEETGRYSAAHHPFTMPHAEDIERLESEPGSVRAYAYDLIINGEEAAGGTIRCHDPEIQEKIFAAMSMSPEDVERRFGFFVDALRYGAPPHGGIAFGLDRWVMLLAGRSNIRDVIAFPKTQRASDLMSDAPSPVDEEQLKELGIRLL